MLLHPLRTMQHYADAQLSGLGSLLALRLRECTTVSPPPLILAPSPIAAVALRLFAPTITSGALPPPLCPPPCDAPAGLRIARQQQRRYWYAMLERVSKWGAADRDACRALVAQYDAERAAHAAFSTATRGGGGPPPFRCIPRSVEAYITLLFASAYSSNPSALHRIWTDMDVLQWNTHPRVWNAMIKASIVYI
jgi:hypothetical protein